jgi:hypothetical protein
MEGGGTVRNRERKSKREGELNQENGRRRRKVRERESL